MEAAAWGNPLPVIVAAIVGGAIVGGGHELQCRCFESQATNTAQGVWADTGYHALHIGHWNAVAGMYSAARPTAAAGTALEAWYTLHLFL